jgi:predicted nuclease of restriction endonuclease-like (RecB) superfamily
VAAGRCGSSGASISQFYERTALSKNKAAMLRGGQQAKSEDAITPEDELRDPLVLEFST